MIVQRPQRYVLGFNMFTLARDELLAFLDTRTEVLNWYTILPSEVYMISHQSASELALLLRERFPGQFFSVAEIANIDGAMPIELWQFLNDPKPSSLRAGGGLRSISMPPLPGTTSPPGLPRTSPPPIEHLLRKPPQAPQSIETETPPKPEPR